MHHSVTTPETTEHVQQVQASAAEVILTIYRFLFNTGLKKKPKSLFIEKVQSKKFSIITKRDKPLLISLKQNAALKGKELIKAIPFVLFRPWKTPTKAPQCSPVLTEASPGMVFSRLKNSLKSKSPVDCSGRTSGWGTSWSAEDCKPTSCSPAWPPLHSTAAHNQWEKTSQCWVSLMWQQ